MHEAHPSIHPSTHPHTTPPSIHEGLCRKRFLLVYIIHLQTHITHPRTLLDQIQSLCPLSLRILSRALLWAGGGSGAADATPATATATATQEAHQPLPASVGVCIFCQGRPPQPVNSAAHPTPDSQRPLPLPRRLPLRRRPHRARPRLPPRLPEHQQPAETAPPKAAAGARDVAGLLLLHVAQDVVGLLWWGVWVRQAGCLIDCDRYPQAPHINQKSPSPHPNP